MQTSRAKTGADKSAHKPAAPAAQPRRKSISAAACESTAETEKSRRKSMAVDAGNKENDKKKAPRPSLSYNELKKSEQSLQTAYET